MHIVLLFVFQWLKSLVFKPTCLKMSFRDHGAQQCDVNAINRLKLAVEPQEMFELFINKLVFYESVSQRLNR